jgi:hypothetical protein
MKFRTFKSKEELLDHVRRTALQAQPGQNAIIRNIKVSFDAEISNIHDRTVELVECVFTDKLVADGIKISKCQVNKLHVIHNVQLENCRSQIDPSVHFEAPINYLVVQGRKNKISQAKIEHFDTADSPGGDITDCAIDWLVIRSRISVLAFTSVHAKSIVVLNMEGTLIMKHLHELQKLELLGGAKEADCAITIDTVHFDPNLPSNTFDLGLVNTKDVKLANINLSNVLLTVHTTSLEFSYEGITWPARYEQYGWQSTPEHISLQLLFTVLKKKSKDKGDEIQERVFASFELQAYYLAQSFSRPKIMFAETKWCYLKKPVFHNFRWSNINLYLLPFDLSYWSNRFGRSWGLPFWWLVLSTIIFYLITILILSSINDTSPRLVWETLNGLGAGYQYLLPTHSFQIFKPYNGNGWIFFIDAIQRIFSGYFIFQFVRAFRFHVAR